MWQQIIDGYKKGFSGIFYKLAIIGERLSPWVSLGCIVMSVRILFFK